MINPTAIARSQHGVTCYRQSTGTGDGTARLHGQSAAQIQSADIESSRIPKSRVARIANRDRAAKITPIRSERDITATGINLCFTCNLNRTGCRHVSRA